MPYNEEELLKLPLEEKIRLAEAIWESIDEDELPAAEHEIQIARERYEMYLKNPEAGIPWEEVKKQLFAKYGL
ncbi:MAG TPA: addiction module protein [Lacibacter sp.]|nr:addiction module protein [Lacibacter sp.]HMO88452.1 addiction module protein [Lacibacter sp.]HMP87814.1 addiction module protein [Lacibacter sp.]